MDDAAFVAQVEELLPQHLQLTGVVITAVRPAQGRPWPSTEVVFEAVPRPRWWSRPIRGTAYLPLGEDWRLASGLEEPASYVLALASAVERAVTRIFNPRELLTAPTPAQVADRWRWLLERLASHGSVRQVSRDELVVVEPEGSSFAVHVSPEEWARIAVPVEHDADDPQDFGIHLEDETHLVLHDDELVWSVRPDLPPVRGGASLRRRLREAQARGKSVGWFAHPPAER